MNRTGHENVNFFVGTEIENTPLKGKVTMFVVGLQEDDQLHWHIGEYNQKLENKGVLDLVVLRILPIMPFNVLNILMGVSRINIQNYM